MGSWTRFSLTRIMSVMLVTTILSYAGLLIVYDDQISVYGRNAREGRKILFDEYESPGTLPRSSKDTVFVIMPTYKRQNQRAILVMQTQILAAAKGIHLILAEDSRTKTPWIQDLLEKSQIHFSQLECAPLLKCPKRTHCARGWAVRNCALKWLNETGFTNGVLYFADDDNFYDVKLFDEIRKTKTVSLFPVGGFPNTWISSPIVRNGRIIDFVDTWKAGRRWPVDMAGFAVSLRFWQQRKCPLFTDSVGFMETKFLDALNISRKNVQILASGGKEVYVWHNSLRASVCNYAQGPLQQKNKWNGTNFESLKSFMMCINRKYTPVNRSRIIRNYKMGPVKRINHPKGKMPKQVVLKKKLSAKIEE